MFETNTDGVVELNVRAKKYYKPSTAYKFSVNYVPLKVKISKEQYDNAYMSFLNDPISMKMLVTHYEPV